MGWLDDPNPQETDIEALLRELRTMEAARGRLTTQVAQSAVGGEQALGLPAPTSLDPTETPIQARPFTLEDLYDTGPATDVTGGANIPMAGGPEHQAASEAERASRFSTPPTEPGIQVIDPYIGHQKLQAGAIETGAKLPFDLAAMLASPAAIGGRAVGVEGPAHVVDWLRETGESVKGGIQSLLGTGPNSDPGARMLEYGGQVMLPAGQLTAPIALGTTALDLIMGPEKTLGERISPSEASVPPEQRPTSGEKGSPYPSWLSSAVAAPLEGMKESSAYRFVTGQPETVMNTQGGPATVKTSELWIMGGLAVGSLGMMAAPRVVRFLRDSVLPTPAVVFRPVRDAATGTETISSPLDLARGYDDANAGLVRVLSRVAPEPVVEAINHRFQYGTRMAAQAVADSSVIAGRAVTPTHTFQSPVALADLGPRETPQVAQYLHLRDTFDEINRTQARQAAAAARGTPPPPGPTTIRGYTMPDVLNEMHALELGFPEVRQISAGYRANLQALRRFESTGEYSTLSRREAVRAQAESPNEVPFRGARTTGEDVERGSAIGTMAEVQRIRVRERIENEAVGMYVDEMNRHGQFFTRVTPQQLTTNPHWKKNTVEFYRRGVKETYTTDPMLADMLKMDPYYISHGLARGVYMTKRLMEATTTGAFAPWFAATSMLRNFHLGIMSTPQGFRMAGPIATTMAIPRQLLPQLTDAVASSLDRGGFASLIRYIPGVGDAGVQAISTRLAHEYERSLYAQLQSVGSHRGSIMEQQIAANTALARAARYVPAPFRALWSAYTASLSAAHNSASFAFARKNYGRVPLTELAVETRRLTGDPRTGGQYYVGKTNKPIRFQEDDSVSHTVGHFLARNYGRVTEAGRVGVPWYNATTQGIKRIGEAYLENPVRFVTNAWMFVGIPSAASYLLSNTLGKDPNGLSYVDYQMNRRSDYKKTMNFYIPIPGRPAEEGIEYPRFHELAPFGRLMEAGLDHMFRTSIFSQKEDTMRTLQSLFNIVIAPPTHPLFNVQDATQGIVSTGGGGIFSGEYYKRKEAPYDQTGGLPGNMEGIIRALAPGLGDVVGAGAAAYIQTPDGFINGVKNMGSEMGRRAVSKTPLLRDVLGMQQPIIGSTDVTDELFKRSKVINSLDEYYKKNTVNQGQVNVKPRSAAGGNLVDTTSIGPQRMPIERVTKGSGAGMWVEPLGQKQPPPTNPLYVQFAEEVHKKFKTDSPKIDDPSGGGIGFQSLWARYGDMTAMLDSLRNINAGNQVNWQERMNPKTRAYLEENGVDPSKLGAVRNFAEKQRQDAARVILFTIRGVEEEFSKAAGRPIRLEDIAPYGKGLTTEQGAGVSTDMMTPY